MTILPTWDLFITLFFIIGLAYGFILQRDKVVLTLIAVYVALVITEAVASPLQQFFAGEKALFNQFFIKGITDNFAIKSIVFLLTIGIVTSKSGLGEGDTGGVLSQLEILSYSFLNSALIASSILFFMDESMRNAFTGGSKFANMLVIYHTWIVLAPVALLIFMGLRKKE